MRVIIVIILYLISSLNSFRFQNSNKHIRHENTAVHLSNNIDTTVLNLDKNKRKNVDNNDFDLPLAVILAGYSFETYNEAPIGKIAIGSDGTRVIFTSSDFIRNIFTGVVMIRLDRGEVVKDYQKEEGLLEVISSGDVVDPYVIMSVQENDKIRVIDSAISSIQKSTSKPTWGETFFLYIMDPSTCQLNFTLMDKDYFKSDDIIGYGSFTVADFLQFKSSNTIGNNNIDNKPVKIPIPIYIEDNDKSWSLLPRAKRKRTGTLFIEASVTNFDMTPRQKTNKLMPKLPTGATPGEVDWVKLLSSVIDNSQTVKNMKQENKNISNDGNNMLSIIDSITTGLHQVCFIDNPDTDTQSSVWADTSNREIIFSFRGTEQIKFKDILTDINLMQVPFLDGTNPGLNDIKVHAGFLKAYKSVQATLLQILQALLKYDNDNEKPWNIYICGHSLGGALATLMAFDIGRINEGYFGSNSDEALKYADDKMFLSYLTNSRIAIYTYGAPRVGDIAFKKLFNRMVPHCYRYCFQTFYCYFILSLLLRIVNNQDIVARIPRASKANRLLAYEHIGKTVIVDDEASGLLWIEGLSSGINPVSEISPFARTNYSVSTITAVDSYNNNFFKDTMKSYIVDSISSVTENLKKNTNSNTQINININSDNARTYNFSISSASVIDNISKFASDTAIDISKKVYYFIIIIIIIIKNFILILIIDC